MTVEKRKRFLINIAFWAVMLGIVYVVFKYLLNLVMPFFLALIFSALLRPLVRFLHKKLRFKYNVAAIICVALFYAALGALLVLISARIITTIVNFVGSVPAIYTDSVEPALRDFFERMEVFATRFDPSVVAMVENAGPQLLSSVGSAVTNFSVRIVTAVSGYATKLPSFLLACIICIISTVFMSLDFKNMTAFLNRQLPQRFKNLAADIRDSFVQIIFRYGKSYALIMLITFAEIALGLLIIGVKKPLLVALLIAIFDIFPIVGAGMILLPWSIISFIQTRFMRGLGLGILYVVVVVVRQIIEPKIIGHHVGLPPLVTLMCMFIGSSLFGGLGLFGLPIMAAIIKNLNDSEAIHLYKREGEDAANDEPEPPDHADGPGDTE